MEATSRLIVTGPETKFRRCDLADGAAIWQVVRESGRLDTNSAYMYLLLCDRFRDTCIAAEQEGILVGFVLSFVPPAHMDTIFIWQVGVAERFRGQGIGLEMLNHLVAMPSCASVKFLEATVTLTNAPSRALFAAFARQHEAAIVQSERYGRELFPNGNHEAEHLLRIGPIGSRMNIAKGDNVAGI
ncbi:MAG: diaminobutyrate acetyltransferase [Proteobacteria bacterium]|nr:diaminobutyrate acetyltransferase [Pseudomonadota bacterium]